MFFTLLNIIAISIIQQRQITTNSRKVKSNKILVVYFSCTENTKRVANNIHSIIGGDLIEIVPTVPYTSEDIDYRNSQSRASKENADTTILPEISTTINNFDQYDTIFLGYPIWFGRSPNIIFNFMKQYNFLNKNIITFCTSSSSSDSSKNYLPQLAPTAKWNDNWQRFSSSVQESSIKEWIKNLNIQSSVLVVYFSATGNTKKIAEYIQKEKLADIKAVEPVQPYTDSDLKYSDQNSRSYKENQDPNSRPEIKSIGSLANYDIIFIGYPIWFGKAPKVMYTFVENNDLSGKTIVPFCTSGSSGLGQSATELESKTQNAKYITGRRFSSSQDENTVVNWVKSLDLNQPDSGDSDEDKDELKDKKIVVSYFSATGNTKRVAENIFSNLKFGRIVEIKPVNTYTSDDLNYNDPNSRSSKEHNNQSFRPEINEIKDIDKAETIFIGYPLWWGEAPNAVYTFVEKYNFKEKTVIPFCTSGSSKMGDSGKHLADKTSGANWFKGQRFASDVDKDKVNKWMDKIIVKNDENEIKFTDKTLSNGLSTGAIIGIVVAAVVVIIVVVIVIVVRKKRQDKSNAEVSN